LAWNPEYIARGFVIGPTTGNEKKIGEAVDIGERAFTHVLALVGFEFHDQAFRAPADGSREMQVRCGGMAAGKHEGTQGAEIVIEIVNFGFEAFNLLWQNAQGFMAGFFTGLGNAEISAEVKKLILNPAQHGIQLAESFRVGVKSDDSQNRIRFIHGAVSLNAEMGLRNAGTGAKCRIALVTGAGIDAVENDHGSDYREKP
jgi:hypothetical protein